MAWIMVSSTCLVAKVEVEEVMAVASVYMVMFSLDTYRVLVEGE